MTCQPTESQQPTEDDTTGDKETVDLSWWLQLAYVPMCGYPAPLGQSGNVAKGSIYFLGLM